MKQQKPQLTDEEICYLLELESDWKANKPKLSDRDWLNIFPEARGILPDLIANRLVDVAVLRVELEQAMRELRQKNLPEVEHYFCVQWLRLTKAEKIAEHNGHLRRFQRLYATFSPQERSGNGVTQEMIDRAISIPTIEVVNRYVKTKRSGARWIAKCPFHPDKTPSFVVYESSYHCFGCGAHGNNINFIRQIENCSFPEAVRRLSNEN